MRKSLFTGVGLAALSFSAFAAPASAQLIDATPDCVDNDRNGVCDEDERVTAEGTTPDNTNVVTITGSRIRVQEADSPARS